jgi:hypothetical protein
VLSNSPSDRLAELYYSAGMSLRPLFAAFSYTGLGHTLFAGDPERTEALARQLGEEQRGARGDFAARAEAALRRLLTEGPQRGGPEDETHVAIVNLLVRSTTSYVAFPESTTWKWSAFEALSEDPRLVLDEEARTFLSALAFGRPLFGDGFDTGWSFYGFLIEEQSRRLHGALAALDREALGPAAPLVAELSGWIARAIELGPDLWVLWS